MAAGDRPDDEDTREHPTGARFPDAAPVGAPPPGPSAPDLSSPPARTTSQAADSEAASDATVAGSPPADQWPQPGGQWQSAPQPAPWQTPAQPGQWPQPGGQWQPPAAQQPAAQQPAAHWPAAQSPSSPQAQWQAPGQWQAPPGQWAGQPGWEAPPAHWQAEYGTSPMVAIAGVVLLIFGIFVTLAGVGGLALGSLIDEIMVELGPIETPGFDPSDIAGVVVIFFGVVLVVGLLHLISSVGVFLHKQWARIIAIVLSVLGTLFGVLALVGSLEARGQAEGGGLAVALVIAIGYGFSLFALVAGSSHFQRRFRR